MEFIKPSKFSRGDVSLLTLLLYLLGSNTSQRKMCSAPKDVPKRVDTHLPAAPD